MTEHAFITEQDAPILMGAQPGIYALWLEKTEGSRDTRIREERESGCTSCGEGLARFERLTGKQVLPGRLYRRGAFRARVHGLVLGEQAGLTLGAGPEREGEIPPDWYFRCLHCMMVLRAERWYLLLGNRVFTLAFKEREIRTLETVERSFLEHLGRGEPPAPDGSAQTRMALAGRIDGSLPPRDLSWAVPWIRQAVNADSPTGPENARLLAAMGGASRAYAPGWELRVEASGRVRIRSVEETNHTL